jgi:hypothetical protein
MNKLEIGEIIRTSYKTGPYEIVTIDRGCRCVTQHEEEEGITELPEHIHLTLYKVGDRTQGIFYLGWYDEETLKSVRQPDHYLVKVPTSRLIQASLF